MTFSQMITSGLLLPQGSSSTTPQYLIVCQSIEDDLTGVYDFASGSEIVFMDNSSELVIPAGSTVRFRNSYLHGCQKLWKRIHVKGGSLELKQSSRVEDGINAVYLEPNSTLVSSETTFDGNVKGVFAGNETGTPNQYIINANIGGTTFSGLKPLIEPYFINPVSYPGCYVDVPLYGMDIINVLQLNIGVTNSQPNIFKDFVFNWYCSIVLGYLAVGINCEDSNISVFNSKFENIDPDVNGGTGRGIRFSSNPVTPSSLIVTGLGQSGTPTFDMVNMGISGSGNMTIKDCNFDDAATGIEYSGNNSTLQSLIRNCSFDLISTEAIRINNNIPVNTFKIVDCIFDDDYEHPIQTFVDIFSIKASSVVPGFQKTQIKDCVFTDQPNISILDGYTAISVSNLYATDISQNTLVDLTGTSGDDGVSFTGIYTFNADQTNIRTNNITGNGDFSPSMSSVAIKMYSSPDSWINCNDLDMTKNGMAFDFDNDGSKIGMNEFNTHFDGLFMHQLAIVGDQDRHGNRWIGNNSINSEAYFNGRQISIPTDVTFVKLSEFFIHDPNMSSDFWPDPRLIGGVPDPGIWFSTAANPAINDECDIPQPPAQMSMIESEEGQLTDARRAVLEGTISDLLPFPALLWGAETRLYGYLLTHPQLLEQDAIAMEWYLQQTEKPAGKLGAIYTRIKALSVFSPEDQYVVDAYNESYKAIALGMEALDTEIPADQHDESLSSDYYEALVDLNNELATLQETYQPLLAEMTNSRIEEALHIKEDLLTIQTQEPWQEDFNTVCKILLDSYETGLTEENKLVLDEIARQCVYSGGQAVIQARASLNQGKLYEIYDDCPDSRASSKHQEETLAMGISLLPNPSSYSALLVLENSPKNGNITLLDMYGAILANWDISGKNNIQLEWPSSMPSGVYFLKIQSDQKNASIHKVIISK